MVKNDKSVKKVLTVIYLNNNNRLKFLEKEKKNNILVRAVVI